MHENDFFNEDLLCALAGVAGEDNVLMSEPMREHTTLKIGGPADVFVTPDTEQGLVATLDTCYRCDLPLTIVGPINATRPVMVLVGALLVFGERLNLYQWAGVLMAVISFFMLSRSGKKEGIDFKHNRYIFYVVLAAVTGAISGLYDKYLMAPVSDGGLGLDRMVVQSWYNIYQLFMMGAVIALLWLPKRKTTTPFHWDWCIILISIFLSAADFVYFYSLSLEGAMISIVSMVRRGSVVVSFLCGALFFREKNLKSKVVDLALVLIGMIFLYLGSK